MKSTINELIDYGVGVLRANKIEEPIVKVRMLLVYVLKKTKEHITINQEEKVSKEKVNKYMDGIEKLKTGIPIEHIINQKEFMKLNFYVDKNVLIPRQDTEVLVEEVLEIASASTEEIKILDLCTGSGAIAVSLSTYLQNALVYASDISKEALKIARENSIKNNTKITVIESDIFENIKDLKFDIIVSNPPYIKTDVIEGLSEQVKCDPIIALDGGKDGLDVYKKIIKAYEHLEEGGILALEIGYDQKEEVIELLEKTGKYNKIECKKDLAGNNRVVIAHKI